MPTNMGRWWTDEEANAPKELVRKRGSIVCVVADLNVPS